jgi:hypothetical protein
MLFTVSLKIYVSKFLGLKEGYYPFAKVPSGKMPLFVYRVSHSPAIGNFLWHLGLTKIQTSIYNLKNENNQSRNFKL